MKKEKKVENEKRSRDMIRCLKERLIGSICLPFRNPYGYSMLEEQTMRISFFVFSSLSGEIEHLRFRRLVMPEKLQEQGTIDVLVYTFYCQFVSGDGEQNK